MLQIMRAYHSTLHSSTLETSKFLMLGRQMRSYEHLTYHVPAPKNSVHKYVDELITCMRTAHEILREQQWQLRSEDSDDPLLYKKRDWVWMINHRQWRTQAANLQPKFVSPYCVIEVMPNHMYKVELSGQVSIQNEARLKPYLASPDAAGQAPPLLEPMHRLTMKRQATADRELEVIVQRTEEVADKPTDWLLAGPKVDTFCHVIFWC